MVEYVLVLIVSVALVMALAYQVFTPLRDFLKSYMGDYIACLLETGELPSLGDASTEEILAEEGCNAKFEAATLAGGRPPNSAQGGKNGDQSQNKNSSDSSSSGGGGSSVGPGSSSRGGNLLISSMKKRNATETGVAAEKVTEIPLADNGSRFYNRRDSYSEGSINRTDKSTYVGIAGLTEEEKKKQARKDGSGRTIAMGENFAPPPKKIPIKKPAAPPTVEAEETPFTLGNFFRFLIIAAIVIALVMVLGSQALKIAKSQEK
ncbi:hypothetical protein [Bdellovibrio sp. HCB337]|uniref:hypothetical protein n=1 Tax=Bdellovibrio sp. HCB337 TaxID=3394358 RepID=UPI0039A47097